MGDFVFHVGRGELKRGDESVKVTEASATCCACLRTVPACQSPATNLLRSLPLLSSPGRHPCPGTSDTPVIPSEHRRVVL
jgi:hypothetical protein